MSIAIVKFPQGIVEIVLRVASTAMALSAFAAAAATVAKTNNSELFRKAEKSHNEEYIELHDKTIGAAGWVVAIGLLALLTEFAMIVIRFLNITIINSNNIFIIVNIILSFVFGLGLLAGGIAMAIFAKDYSDYLDRPIFFGVAKNEFEAIHNSLAVGTAFCILAAITFAFLGVWMILFLLRKWNDKLINYIK